MKLVTLQEAKDHLAMDHDADDALIGSLIDACSGAVLTYLEGAPIGDPVRDYQGAIVYDSNGDPEYEQDSNGIIVRPQIKAAVLLYMAELYKHRETNQDGQIPADIGYGYLPHSVTALLFPLRQLVVS